MVPLPSILPQVSEQIERHPQALRMKKMLVCAWQDTWENDPQRLQAIAIRELIQSAIDKYPTIEALSESLSNIANTLNKKQEYQAIANTIVLHLGKLYGDSDEATQMFTAPPTHITVARYSENLSYEPEREKPVHSEIRTGYDPFDLRLELMRYTNPLRAKILLFSALQNKSTLDEHDWANLKTQNLDTLLYTIYEQCQTFTQLENYLCTTANTLEERSESNQAAGAILQSMGRYYTEWEPGMEDVVTAAQTRQNASELTHSTIFTRPETYSGNTTSTRQILPS